MDGGDKIKSQYYRLCKAAQRDGGCVEIVRGYGGKEERGEVASNKPLPDADCLNNFIDTYSRI